MIRIVKTFQYIAIMALIVFSAQVYGQVSYVLTPGQQFKVEGTSTLHDWEMVSAKAEGNANITLEGSKIASISSLIVNLPVTSLKNGKSAMEKNAYEALWAEKYPQIQWELAEVEAITDQLVKTKLKLSIAGTTRTVDLDVSYKLSEEGVLFSGSQKIKFSDFHIAPPTAMFGAIKTGDDLILSFETTFKSIN